MVDRRPNQEIIESIRNDLMKMVAQQQFSFEPEDSLVSRAPHTCICTLMENIETGEQEYRPDKILAKDETVVSVLDNPGWKPVTLGIIEIDLHLEMEEYQ